MEIRISDELGGIIKYAREEAMRTGSYGIGPDHLFLGIIRHGENAACKALIDLGADLGTMKSYIDARVFTGEELPYSEMDNIAYSRQSQNVLSIAVLEASRLGMEEALSQHLLLALARASGTYGMTFLRSLDIDYGKIIHYLQENGLLGEPHKEEPEPVSQEEEDDPEEQQGAKGSGVASYGYDLTQAARDGKLDPVVGRDVEISRVVEILGRRKKNNPMLLGEPGVGKSAIVEGIALRIASGEIPAPLAKKRIISLDIASVVAGTRYRGDFEKRLKTIIKEASEDPDLILFIDEFHTIVGAGGAQGSLDAANMLKPALARGEFQCIGATTMDEFTKIIEKDGALDRRFQKIVVEPTSQADTLNILRRLRPGYEEFHGVVFSDDALEACVRLTDRYVTDKFLPDKAIDVLDEAGSMVRLRGVAGKRGKTVGAEDIATVVSRMTGIPAGKVAESEGARILKMKKWLSDRIIGQDEAVDTVTRAIRRGRAGLKDPNRPLGTFLFFGPTGVGKTQLARSLAEYLFDSEDALVRIDMSEYGEKFNVSRLIGAPPGYVGYEEGGQLSERVRRKPYCVVLLDEIEKAHPDIYNLLLQVMDEGRLTDSNGRTVDFKNTILIMTSNVGSRELEEYGNGMGFKTSSSSPADDKKSVLSKAVRKAFPPEFVNRVDEQIFFNPLSKEDIERIIDIQLKGLRDRALEAGYTLVVTPAAKRLVADAGYDPLYGARPLKRALVRLVEDPVSEFIISDRMLSGKDAKVAEPKKLRVGLSPDGEGTAVSTKEPAAAPTEA
ncbi:MAG: ATP-dependent Clp protease ATP-binding subunit [Bacteroidales bacterium]|nr:ATP-dependent Clp protease ATP-binding subunit [Bacteroidales bacterium]